MTRFRCIGFDAPRCRGTKHRARGYCPKCYSRWRRSQDPVRTSWENLKFNSNRRGINFEISLPEFRRFCVKTDYIAQVGKTKQSASLDRIIEDDKSIGYTLSNICKMSLSDNSKKAAARRAKTLHYHYDDRIGKMIFWVIDDKGHREDIAEGVPF